MFDYLDKVMAFFGILFIVFVPLGIWKLIEIIIFIFKHIKIV